MGKLNKTVHVPGTQKVLRRVVVIVVIIVIVISPLCSFLPLNPCSAVCAAHLALSYLLTDDIFMSHLNSYCLTI